ncbi:sugar phosphate isomerase/epimerase family protein [Natronosalvus caseinilyticus]|uniref:sugar phosphate isomerase/epimerase family protein n=1 Tax=Natronosalvus caseinilyticus TaxID=2953747 RepID=UPI0028AAE4BD|nr:sugar phosphate isomerase/epimerase family protein [Natronosalvus caseinilyticus]
MRFGLNQSGFPADDLETTCEILSAAGYDGIEPNLERGGPLTTDAGRREVAATIADYGLEVPAISTIEHWEYPLSSSEDERREVGMELAKNMIDAAVALDAENVLIVPAVIEDGREYDLGYDQAVESVRELAGYAEARDVTLALENVQNNFLPSPTEFEAFLEEVSEAGPVAAYFDVGNALRSGLPSRWLATLQGQISRIHVKDWLVDNHRVTYPPQGDVDWERVRETLSEIEYDGWITAEVPAYPSFPERMPVDVLETMRFLFGDGGERA